MINNKKLDNNYTSQYNRKSEKENNRNNLQILDARIQKRKRKNIKRKKRLDHHIADLTSKFFEKQNPCLLKMVTVNLWRTVNTKPKLLVVDDGVDCN